MSLLLKYSLLMAVLFGFHCSAAISATTANTIIGTAPGLSFDHGTTIADNLDDLLTFTMPDGVEIVTSAHDEIIMLSLGDRPKDLTTFIVADGQPRIIDDSYYKDLEDDPPHETTPISGSITATWHDSMGNVVTDIGKNLSSCLAPYSLTITANDIAVHSNYGLPATYEYGSVSKIYQFNIESYDICFLKPNDSAANSMQFGPGPIKFPSGYNSEVFIPNYGYSIDGLKSKNKTFPTTGFNQAQFLLKMSTAQSDYTYSSNNANVSISNVSGAEGSVTLGPDKPQGLVTLTATPKEPISAPAITHSFTITLWAEPKNRAYQYSASLPITTATQFPAASICKDNTLTSVTSAIEASQYLLKREQISNTPYADNTIYPAGTSPPFPGYNYYSRDADGTLNSEWGNLLKYSSANWPKVVWTSEYWGQDRQFTANVSTGNMGYYLGTDNYSIACLR